MTEWTSPDGSIRLINADCLTVLDSLSGIDAVVTDPPYGIGLENHARGKERSDTDWTIAGDGTQEVGQHAIDWAEKNGIPCIAFASPMKPWRGNWRQYLVWEKGEHVSGGGDPGTCWKPSWELLQVARNRPLNGNREGAVLRFLADKDDYRWHPSPKPVPLIEYLIAKATQPGDLVLDPFAGRAPVAIACIRTGRKFVGCEIERRHFSNAVRRIEAELRQPRLFPAAPVETQAELFKEMA